MPTDIKAYWKEIGTKAGLTAEQLSQVDTLLADPVVGKVFNDGFKTISDYSRDLDATRDRTKTETEAGFKKWYADNVEKPWAGMKTKAEMADKYKELYGDLDADPNPNLNGNSKSTVHALTEEKIAELLDTRLKQRDSAVLDLLDIRERHMSTFKKSLSIKDFETAWKDHPEWGSSMQMAYEKFTEPETSKLRETEMNVKIEEEVNKRLADAASRRGIPLDHGHKGFSPMFDKKEDITKLDPLAQDRHSREAFFAGLNEGAVKP